MVQNDTQTLFRSITTLLNESQDSAASHSKLIGRCQQIYKQADATSFFDKFTLAMQPIMTTMQKNPHIEHIIDFIAKFASSLSVVSAAAAPPAKNNNSTISSNEQNGDTTQRAGSQNDEQQTLMDIDDGGECDNPFLTNLIDYLIDCNKSNSDAVRHRCCQVLSKLMAAINNEQFIDEDLYDRLCDALLERLKDINSRVQVQAIAGIYRLQDPNDRECRVIKALLFLMTYDPHWQVRYQALAHVAFSRHTLPEIIDRVRDPSANVRRKALLILSEKVLIKFISIEKRLFILNYSLKDSDPGVLDTCCKKLLPSWLAFKENDVCKLLKALDVVDATDTVELMLSKMHAEHTLDALCAELQQSVLSERRIVPLERLDAESVFYWCWVCGKCRQGGGATVNRQQQQQQQHIKESINAAVAASASDDTIANADDTLTAPVANDEDDNLDTLLPSLTEYCDYIYQ